MNTGKVYYIYILNSFYFSVMDEIYQSLFFPDIESPLNSTIALEMINDQDKFCSNVEDWVLKYAQ